MKKALAAILCLAMALSLAAFSAYAETEDGYEFEIVDSKAVITNYIGAGGNVIIPETLGGYPVTRIGTSAFERCDKITAVTIPDSVVFIDDYAFSGCTRLASFALPDNAIIGDSVFGNTAYYNDPANWENGVLYVGHHLYHAVGVLGAYTIKDGTVSICPRAFTDSSRVAFLTFPDSIKRIGPQAFVNCTRFSSLIIPDGAISIGDYAFSGCASLEMVKLPDSLESIGNGAFCLCTRLTAITIPEGVTHIGNSVFGNCAYLAEISVDKDNLYYKSINGVLYNKDVTEVIQHPEGKTGAYDMPESVTTISERAFYACSGITSITISNKVTEISNSAFFGCKGIRSVKIPNSVKTIGERAFLGCILLTSITFPNSVTEIKSEAIRECSGLGSVYIYNGRCVIASDAQFPTAATVYGSRLSTAEVYAAKNGNRFSYLVGEFLFGDVDLSGTITIADALLLFKHVAGVELLSNRYALTFADIDGNGGITIADALTLFKLVAGVISEF